MSVERSVLNVERSAPHGAVFLSYASQDAEAARRICEALRAAGVEVWFDQSELVGGDAWDQKIRKQIKDCALFVPVISANTQARREGYFRIEWKLAAQRTHAFADGTPFILPVVIDTTRDGEALVPEEFRAVQWTRLPGVMPAPQFVEQVKRLLSGELEAGRPRPAMKTRGEVAASPKKSGLPGWMWGALAAVLAIVAVGIVIPRQSAPVIAPPKSATESKAPAVPVVLPPDAKSIAVLLFKNFSEDKANAFFTDGIHEEILTNLAHIRELHVVSSTSVGQYRDSRKPLRQIAQELGVAYVLEGSVQRAGNRVRVTGQLIRAATDEHVWAQAYDRDLTDIFAIQSEVAQAIATALAATLSPDEQRLLAQRPTENLAAYDAYLKGRAAGNERRSAAGLQRQEKAFQQAVGLDPGFAAAWGELAVVQARFAALGFDHSPTRLAQADAAMARAVALAPESPEVIRLDGLHAVAAYHDYARATAAFEKLGRLQPNDPTVWFELAGMESSREKWSRALADASKATRLDPANANFSARLVETCTAMRHWDEAGAEQRRLLALQPNDLRQRLRLALLAFQATGDTKPAQAFFAGLTPAEANTADLLSARKDWDFMHGDLSHFLQLDRVFPYHPDFLTVEGNPERAAMAAISAFAFLGCGDPAGARTRLGDLPEQIRAKAAEQPDTAQLWTSLAVMEAILGRREAALDAARRSLELSTAQDGMGRPRSVWALNTAVAEAWVGDKDRAFTELVRLMQCPLNDFFTQGPPTVHGLRGSPLFQPLKNDPRWEALLADPKNNAPLF